MKKLIVLLAMLISSINIQTIGLNINTAEIRQFCLVYNQHLERMIEKYNNSLVYERFDNNDDEAYSYELECTPCFIMEQVETLKGYGYQEDEVKQLVLKVLTLKDHPYHVSPSDIFESPNNFISIREKDMVAKLYGYEDYNDQNVKMYDLQVGTARIVQQINNLMRLRCIMKCMVPLFKTYLTTFQLPSAAQ